MYGLSGHSAVCLDVMLGGFLGVIGGVNVVTVGQVSMVSGQFVVTAFVVPGGFMVVARSVLVMFRCLLVMLNCFVCHEEFLSVPLFRGTGGLSRPVNTRWVTALRIGDEKETGTVEKFEA